MLRASVNRQVRLIPPNVFTPIQRSNCTTNGSSFDWQSAYTQLLADRENERKAMERKILEAKPLVMRKAAMAFLPFYDDLQRYREFSTPDKSETAVLETSFLNSLSQLGVTKIITNIGDKYDPKFHEAVAALGEKSHDGENEHLVVAELVNAGFMLNGSQVLRPSKVITSWK